jgi:7,8-dihydropterin-6-yl-methyl-4-(beta-D-ribofuranosyl)aminobenzene 5'-phosphate synthase
MAATEEVLTVAFAVVYDNNAYVAASEPSVEAPMLRTSWGFACWVEVDDTTLLFDTGGDGDTLMANLASLGLDPSAIDAVVLSHAHGDHTGGLMPLLSTGITPIVYVPASFPAAFKRDVRRYTDLVEVTDGAMIKPAVYTTGEVGSGIIEQALVVKTRDGLVVITGCAHPGVVEMVRRAKEVAADASDSQGTASGLRVALVMGGFHLGGASRAQVEAIVEDFRDLGVDRVAPCHCTGDQARQHFADSFGEDCTLAGVGWSTQMILPH